MKRSLAAVLFVSLALSGCGSATEGLDFKAPAGWTAMPSALGFGRMQMWFKPATAGKPGQMLMLIRGQTATTMNFKTIPQLGSIHNQKLSTITICGNKKAQFLTAVSSSAKSGDETFEMVSTPVGDQSYLSLYIRPQSDPADPAAETAIRSLCAAKS